MPSAARRNASAGDIGFEKSTPARSSRTCGGVISLATGLSGMVEMKVSIRWSSCDQSSRRSCALRSNGSRVDNVGAFFELIEIPKLPFGDIAPSAVVSYRWRPCRLFRSEEPAGRQRYKNFTRALCARLAFSPRARLGLACARGPSDSRPDCHLRGPRDGMEPRSTRDSLRRRGLLRAR